jgi:hypothetical protein
MSKDKNTQKEDNKSIVNKQKGFFNPNFKGKSNSFFGQRNTFQKQIRNNHRPQG